MLWIETGIAPPKETLLDEANKANAKVLHLPALAVQNLHTEFTLEGFDAAFVASPRAAKIACEQLKNCSCNIYAVGEGSAKAVEKIGIAVKQFGDGSGAENFLNELFAGNVKPCKKIAWISAKETAADLKALAQKFEIDISHIAVYKTTAAEFTTEQISKIEHPCRWLLRSGKGVLAVKQFFKECDTLEAFGKSAEEALRQV